MLGKVSRAGAAALPRQASSDPSEIFAQGKRALEGGEFAVAEDCFTRVIAIDPGSAAAHTNLAVAYMRERKFDDALRELARSRSLKPGDPGVDLNLGLAYYRKNDFASAIAPFRRSLEESPTSLQARYLLGLCYFFTSNYEQASETLAPLWDRESANLNYLYVLSIAASKVTDVALQKKAFERMLAIGQDTPEFHLFVGKAWLAEHDTEKALQEFQSAARAQPKLPLVHYFIGRTYLEQHNYDLAAGELLENAAIEPDFVYDYEDLGILYAQLGNSSKAEEYFQKALARNAFLVDSCFGLAKLYRASGRLKEALTLLDRAEAMAPQSASLHYTKGQVYARLGDPNKARQEFTQSAKLLHAFNDRLQQGPSGDISADAQGAAEQ